MKKTEVVNIRTTKAFKRCLGVVSENKHTSYIERKVLPDMRQIEIIQEGLSVFVRYKGKILEKRTVKSIEEIPQIITNLKEKWEV